MLLRIRRKLNASILPSMCVSALLGILIVASYARFLDDAKHHPKANELITTEGGTQSPACGRPDDKRIQIPFDWTTFTPPAPGQSYIDPVFGCNVTRLTNSSVEETLPDGTHLGFMHYYSTFSPINATDSMLLITADNGTWRIKDIEGKVVVDSNKMPTMNNGHPVWDASNGSLFFYTEGKTLSQGTVVGNTVRSKVLHKFDEYAGIVSPDSADLSQDGDHVALVGQNRNNTMDIFVWSLSKQAKTSVYTTTCTTAGSVTATPQPGCLHKLQLTADNLLSIEFADDGAGLEQGVRLWDGAKLTPLQDATNHYDTGYDLTGSPVFIAVGNPATLAGLTNPCPSGWGLDVRQQRHLSSAVCLLDKQPSWHVSYRGGSRQPWVAISFFDSRKEGPEFYTNDQNYRGPSPGNWMLYEDEVLLARIDGSAVYRLAQARSRSAESYWAQPHAAISRDGSYVVFTSNMAYPNGCPAKMHVPNDCTDVYLIRVL